MSFDDIVSFLSKSETHGTTEPIDVVKTHGALIFLSDTHAYKIKRPVIYDYLDFSTLAKRHAMLARELELNGPGAPELYFGLVPVTLARDGNMQLGGDGTVIEWCLHMRRFPQGAELSDVAARGALTREIAEDLGRVIAELHQQSKVCHTDGQALVGEIAHELDVTLSGMTDIFAPDRLDRFRSSVQEWIDRYAALLTKRSKDGFVRRGHGDLHLGNLVLLNGRPVPFDALEFNERLGTLDVLYDLSFVLMDLLHRGLSEAANAVLLAYLLREDEPDQLDGLALMPLFLALRAAIRAMVSVQSGRFSENNGTANNAEATAYLDDAIEYLTPPRPRLVVVGGLSGTGKTTLARQLAPRIGSGSGAIHLRSDLERKAVFDVDPLTRLPETAYTPEVGGIVYHRLLEKAKRILAAEYSVIVDAVFAGEEDRRRFAELATDTQARFTGFWLTADKQTIISRVNSRQSDASDANADVVCKQLAQHINAPEWISVDASGPAETTLARSLKFI